MYAPAVSMCLMCGSCQRTPPYIIMLQQLITLSMILTWDCYCSWGVLPLGCRLWDIHSPYHKQERRRDDRGCSETWAPQGCHRLLYSPAHTYIDPGISYGSQSHLSCRPTIVGDAEEPGNFPVIWTLWCLVYCCAGVSGWLDAGLGVFWDDQLLGDWLYWCHCRRHFSSLSMVNQEALLGSTDLLRFETFCNDTEPMTVVKICKNLDDHLTTSDLS